ncbi:zinc metalloprotease [Capillimicrobium parvum]|uniref:DUF3152 domain-containing protein n=1 Tax=Capillimicrobium parvum TaxID=2884022 RepID=A0A9E6Y3J4_9ACTN|nr:hypothetical protein [Capillimicrobium parvum]UGS38782.1 hypothetical protein DSM104329_05212 [Capillimicrobium parvum]
MDGRKLSTMLAAVALALTGASTATAAPGDDTGAAPEVRFGVGTPAMLAAQDLARRTWGTDPCGGRIDIVWDVDAATINARSSWANPRSAYDAPELNVQCRIVLNRLIDYDWARFCTVLVHEYGHLAGRAHTADGPDVMSPIYRGPLPACLEVADPAAASAAPVAAPAPTASARADRPRGRRGSRARARRAPLRAAARRG